MSSQIRATALPAGVVTIAVDPSTEPFWRPARERRLVAPRCADCGAFRLPPTPFCPHCQSTAVDWTELSGRATVYTYTVVNGYPGLPDITWSLRLSVAPPAPAPGVRRCYRRRRAGTRRHRLDAGRLAHYKCPKSVIFLDSPPRPVAGTMARPNEHLRRKGRASCT